MPVTITIRMADVFLLLGQTWILSLVLDFFISKLFGGWEVRVILLSTYYE